MHGDDVAMSEESNPGDEDAGGVQARGHRDAARLNRRNAAVLAEAAREISRRMG